MASPLLTEHDSAVTTITLNRPEKRNALSADMVEALLAALALAKEDGTRLLVIQGAGKGFSGGFDFGGLEEQSDGDLALRFVRLELLLQEIHHAPFATLALVHGACYGAAADIVCSCVRRVAAPDSRFRMPGLRFGLSLGTRRLAAVVGADAARRLLETSKVFDAEQALACRFLTDIGEPDAWPGLVAETADAAKALPMAAQKLLLAQTVDDHRAADLATVVRSVAEPGLKDRVRAFLADARLAGKQ